MMNFSPLFLFGTWISMYPRAWQKHLCSYRVRKVHCTEEKNIPLICFFSEAFEWCPSSLKSQLCYDKSKFFYTALSLPSMDFKAALTRTHSTKSKRYIVFPIPLLCAFRSAVIHYFFSWQKQTSIIYILKNPYVSSYSKSNHHLGTDVLKKINHFA